RAGTPLLRVHEVWAEGRFSLVLSQELAARDGEAAPEPMVIPVALGLIGADGAEVAPTQVVALDTVERTLHWEGLGARPVPSLLRGFSAPVRLEHEAAPGALAHLLAHDTDPVARWEAGRR